jgi:hypothetical protein
MGTKKEAIPPALRWQIWERDNFTCHYCGSRKRLAIDHKIPESQGGKLDPDNLLTACVPCNSEKGTKDYEEYLYDREFRAALEHEFQRIMVEEGSFLDTKESYIRLCKFASIHVMLKNNPESCTNVIKIDPDTGRQKEYWIFFKNAPPEHFAELIEDRRRRGLASEADRFLTLARERFPDFNLPSCTQ